VQETPAGRSVPAVLLRDGQRTTVSVTPEEGNRFSFERLQDLEEMARGFALRVPPVPPTPRAPNAPNPPETPPHPPTVFRFDEMLGRNQLGVTLQSLAPQLAEYFGVTEGVLVTSVSDGSVAATAGLQAGDVITSFNGASVNDPGDLRRQVQQLKDGEDFTVAVTRDHKAVTLKGKADWPERRRPATRTRL
jgi:S1-C subfamily serine protease